MKSYNTILATAGLVASVSAHGRFTSPAPRTAGQAFAGACGQQAFYQVSADPNGNVQGLLQVVRGQSDYRADACIANLCKGLKYEDPPARFLRLPGHLTSTVGQRETSGPKRLVLRGT
ncbi:hypothetical protein KVT40_005840 [Elsinoe batatas]|uniref:Uncharacterized protein n=1 Tax=Elsinoe batatas TaxID=2601811 RepID=A0A8K0PCG4_9PEZI|nr:hypothetical protein KVT40_005840 [Elsinoe batatas]